MPDVISVTPLGGHRLHLEFEDGIAGELDLDTWVQFTGVFEPLQDEAEFARVRIGVGTIFWPTGADICPDVLYSKVTGKPIPGATDENGSSGPGR